VSGSSSTTQSSLSIINGTIRYPYMILVQLTVNDSYYFGQTVIDISQSALNYFSNNTNGVNTNIYNESNSATNSSSSTNSCGNLLKVITSNVANKVIAPSEIQLLNNIYNTFSSNSSSGTFNVIPPNIGQLPSPLISYFCDIDWVPYIQSNISVPEYNTQVVLQLLNNINNIPFGGSPLYDSIYQTGVNLSVNTLDGVSKNIYVFTDNENNLSFYNQQQVISEINNIDISNPVSIIGAELSVTYPITVSNLLDQAGNIGINFLSGHTNGQSITLLSENYESYYVTQLLGNIVGSIGYGSVSFTIEAPNGYTINNLSTQTVTPPGTNIETIVSTSTNNNTSQTVTSDGTYTAGVNGTSAVT
jgi:hypothetical protein